MREQILNFLKDRIEDAYQDRDLSITHYLDLGNGYAVVLTWEEGFDTENEHELCASLRIANSNYFVFDWAIVEEDISLQENKVNYEDVANYMVNLIEKHTVLD